MFSLFPLLSPQRASASAVFFSLAMASVAGAETITGTVTNKTINKPSGGDEVTLIRLAQGMQESTRTKTDARGHFSLNVPDEGVHLVRVTHDGANYFRPAPPGTESVELDVYNAAAKVEGVTSEADVLRIQTEEGGKALRVVENFFVKNDSNPPRTQFSDRPFEFYLPAGAVVEGSAALGPGGMPVQATPVPLGDPNHYTFQFPVRPGETRFQITYRLPYSGSLTLAPRPVLSTDTIAIMMPKSMTFKAGTSAPYTAINDEVEAQTYVARNVQPSQPLAFTVGGQGQLPRDTATGAGGQGAGAQAAGGDGAAAGGTAGAAGTSQASAATDTRPGGGLGNPIDPGGTNDPWAKYKWWIIGGLGLVLAAGGGVMLRGGVGGAATAAASRARDESGVAPAGAGGSAGGSTLRALKDELFALETDRLQGRIGEPEYLEQKAALETVLKRALGRSEVAAEVSKPSVV